MGSMFRSEQMALCQLFLQPEAAYNIISELGERGMVQFRDTSPDANAFQRKFVNEVRRCDELERKLRYIEIEMKKEALNIPYAEVIPNAPLPREITDLEARIEKIEQEIRELSSNSINLTTNYQELLELQQVLDKTAGFFTNQEEDFSSRALLADEANRGGQLSFVAGVVQRERVFAFEKMLWRISRGNVYVRSVDLDKNFVDPATGHEVRKTAFVAFCQGEQLKIRVKKVCIGFRATVHQCPENASERENLLKNVNTQIEDLTLVLNQTRDHRQCVLVGASKELHTWMVKIRKMKAIYHTLNMFNVDLTGPCMIGECWLPVNELPAVQKMLAEKSDGSTVVSFIHVIHTNERPPTYNKSNKFTQGFQNLIDSYGMSSYREANPALYTIITFPFLFAIMFGDLGHGIILLLFGAYLCIYEKKIIAQRINSEVFNIFFGGRYIILLMGLFSIYTGAIYNDIFSKSANVFGSSWAVDHSYLLRTNDTVWPTGWDTAEDTINPTTDYTGTPYPFGVDPVWMMAKNKIIFLNSYKMKLSIVIGVIHMMFGVCMAVFNHVHFRKYSSILLEFLPQFLFLTCLFFYMVFMIIYKWASYGSDKDLPTDSTGRCAPSVLILFINMMLFKHSDPPEGCSKEFMFDGQEGLQKALVAIALVCVPIMLLGKPLLVMLTKKKPSAPITSSNGDLNAGLELSSMEREVLDASKQQDTHGGHGDEEEPISEVFIHQAIHTIEYVLSTISHTASYLRLWALSLAHAQLSEVLWSMVFHIALSMQFDGPGLGGVVIYVIFAVWAVLTLSILVMMEGLSAFLHTLRLHWVEFMSKFFEGLGYAFEPFSFKGLLDKEVETAEAS